MQAKARETTVVLPMASDADLAVWERLDDVIMGGQSSSTLSAAGDGSGADFSGDLIIEGGGFCGARTKVLHFHATVSLLYVLHLSCQARFSSVFLAMFALGVAARFTLAPLPAEDGTTPNSRI